MGEGSPRVAASNDDDDEDEVEDGAILRFRWLDPNASGDACRRETDRPDRDPHDPDPYAELLNRPVAEVVARICKDLDITPDSIRWELAAGRVDEALAPLLGDPQSPAPPWPDTA